MPRQQKKTTNPSEGSEDKSVLIQDANIWTDKGILTGSILIEQGRIRRIARRITEDHDAERVRASGLLALPGLVDVHVHLRDMKLAYKEDFSTGTAAAAAGGFTTVIDMPNTNPPTDSAKRLTEKEETAAGRIHVNVGFHAAAVSDSQTIRAMANKGAFSLKLYMPRPIARLDVGDDAELLGLMNASRDAGLPVTVHAEDPEVMENAGRSRSFLEMAKTRSPDSETRAVNRIVALQKRSGCSVHLCHLTLPSSLTSAQSSREKITTEVTPHHLLLSWDVLSRLGWRAWMVPPLRSENARKELLKATIKGLGTVIASDHAPHSAREKDRPSWRSSPGVPGLETTLALLLTMVNRGVLTLSRLVGLLAINPARVFGLQSKGRLEPGGDGDVVLVDLKKKSKVDSSKFFSKAKFSPFDGFQTKGAVHSTIVNGTIVYSGGEIAAKEGCGSVLRRNVPF